MRAYVFPGQGAQYVGMGKDLSEGSGLARELFTKANNILGFNITEIMFEGTEEDLRQTKVTQPAIFLHSVILSRENPSGLNHLKKSRKTLMKSAPTARFHAFFWLMAML